MKRLGNLTVSAAALVAIAAGGYLLGECNGRSYQKAVAEDQATDVRTARVAGDFALARAAWRQERDSLARKGAVAAGAATAARHRADSLEGVARSAGALVPQPVVQAALDAKNQELAAKDAVIAQDSIGIRARDRQILALAGTVRSYRDTIVPRLTRDRDRWRRRALSRCGPEVAAGLAARGGFDAVAGFGCRLPMPRLPRLLPF